MTSDTRSFNRKGHEGRKEEGILKFFSSFAAFAVKLLPIDDNSATLANIYSGAPPSPGQDKSMHALRVSSLPFLLFVLVIAGCGGSSTGQPPVIAQASEFLYVGTSQPGLLKLSVASDGSLTPAGLGRSAPAVCSPELTPVPGQIFVFSRLCPFSPTETELRRLELTPDGNIASSTPPISFGPDLPSNTGFALSFLLDRDGKLGYAWSVALDGLQHVSPVQIDAAGHLTVKPDLGIFFPFLDPIASRCSDSHVPDAILHTADGLFLSVQDSMVCAGGDGPNVRDSLYAIDSQSGAIGNLLGAVNIEFPPQSFFIAYSGALALAGDTHLPGLGTNKLQLLQISARSGVTQMQQCFSDHPACAHPDAGTFHPSGKWVFVGRSGRGRNLDYSCGRQYARAGKGIVSFSQSVGRHAFCLLLKWKLPLCGPVVRCQPRPNPRVHGRPQNRLFDSGSRLALVNRHG